MRVSHRAGGMTSSESSDSRHDSATIATVVATAVVRFEAIDVAVEVTTPCIPLTSLVRRDCTSPPRVRVKKPSDWRCRWREHRGAQLVHHPLPDLRRQPGLHDAEQLGHDGDGDHRADGQQQQPRVLLRQGDVDHLAHEEGLGQRDDAGHDDDRDDDGHPQAVRAEEREHPRQGHGGLGELGAVTRVDAHRATAAAATATAVGCRGVGCAGGAGEGGGHGEGVRRSWSVGRGERVWVRVAVMRTPPLGRELVVRSLIVRLPHNEPNAAHGASIPG